MERSRSTGRGEYVGKFAAGERSEPAERCAGLRCRAERGYRMPTDRGSACISSWVVLGHAAGTHTSTLPRSSRPTSASVGQGEPGLGCGAVVRSRTCPTRQPEAVGLPVLGGHRRVTALPEEVATLSGIGADYYPPRARQRHQRLGWPTWTASLMHFASTTQACPPRRLLRATAGGARAARKRRPAQHRVRLAVRRLLDALHLTPAFVVDRRMDILALNDLGRALCGPVFDAPCPRRTTPVSSSSMEGPANCGGNGRRWWPTRSSPCYGLCWPRPLRLSDLIGVRSTRSEEFRVRAGPSTTSTPTAPGSRGSITPS
jgi:hypothetical protein